MHYLLAWQKACRKRVMMSPMYVIMICNLLMMRRFSSAQLSKIGRSFLLILILERY